MIQSLYSALVLSAFFSSFALTSIAKAEKFNLDLSHSTIGFKIKHLVISSVSGRFNKFEGTFDFDEKSGKGENTLIKIDAASIDTNDQKRDKHLRSPDFFDVEKFPTIEFKTANFISDSSKPTPISGTLTLHGITKPAIFSLEYKGTNKDPWGNKRVGFEATTEINRKDFGISWNKTLDTGGVMIGETVKIFIEGEAIAEGAKPAKK